MADEQKVTITLSKKQRRGIKGPVIHILTPDGRVTEFKDRVIVVPDGEADGMYALLINRHGEPYVTPDGEPAMVGVPTFNTVDGRQPVVVEIPVIAIDQVIPDPDRLLTWDDVARLVGKSVKTVERMVTDKLLPRPFKVRAAAGGRGSAFREGDVREALRKLPK